MSYHATPLIPLTKKRTYLIRKERCASRFVEKNNFLRMSSLSLSYEVPTNFIQKYGLKRMFLELLTNDLFYLSTAKRERGLNYPYDRSFEFSLRFSL